MSTIPTCAVTGAIPGDGGACGDCDPCIDGEALVPEAVKRLIAEKNSLLHRLGELETTLATVAVFIDGEPIANAVVVPEGEPARGDHPSLLATINSALRRT